MFSVLINAIWMLAEFLVGYGFILCGIDLYDSSVFRIVVVEIDCVNLNCMFKRNFFMMRISKIFRIGIIFILLLIPIGSMFVVYNIFMLSIEINQKKYISESWTSLVIILLINIVTFKLYLIFVKGKRVAKI